MKTRKHLSNRLKELRSNYECGGCNIYFDSAYVLHDHMRDHVEGGSYYYNNAIQTAFPLSITTEAATQTCSSDLEDTKVDKIPELVQSIKQEESSDTDTYDDYGDWNGEVNDDENEAGKTTLANTTEKRKPNDKVPLSVIAGPLPGSKRKVASNVEKSVIHTSKRSRKSSSPLTKANTNDCSEITEHFSKQSSLHIQDIRVSLSRIDDVITTEKPHELTVSKENSIKRLHRTDDGLTEGICKKPVLMEEKKTLLRRSKRRSVRKTNRDSDESGQSEDENDKSDPDYKPEGSSNESHVPFNDDKTDIAEEDNGDSYWKKAKLECQDMKCEQCNKFVENAFSKANLLALHNIPFRQENGRIFIKSSKALHKVSELWINLSTRKKIIPRKKNNEKTECKECGKILKSDYLTTHMVKYHNVARKSKGRPKKDKYYICETCSKPVRRNRRKKHELTHMHMKTFNKSESEEVNAVCEICGRMYLNARSLLTHMHVHSIKNLTCKHCGHVSASIEGREKHKKTHRVFHGCETCGCKFAEKKGLLAHIRRIHQKIMKSVCDVCGRQFYNSYNMVVHRATHFAPSLECGYCDRKFCDPNALKRHVMTHTGDVRYTCHICNHGFIQSTPYWLHMQKRHSISKEEAMAIHRKKVTDEQELKLKFENNWAENLDCVVMQDPK